MPPISPPKNALTATTTHWRWLKVISETVCAIAAMSEYLRATSALKERQEASKYAKSDNQSLYDNGTNK